MLCLGLETVLMVTCSHIHLPCYALHLFHSTKNGERKLDIPPPSYENVVRKLLSKKFRPSVIEQGGWKSWPTQLPDHLFDHFMWKF